MGKKLLETKVLSCADPRWIFLNADENHDKYYYVRHGGPNRILEPLGSFERCDSYSSNLDDKYVHYWIRFDNVERVRRMMKTQRVSENDELYYTDEPPAAGSVPLTINNIPPASSLSKGGKKTKKNRGKNKKYKTFRNNK